MKKTAFTHPALLSAFCGISLNTQSAVIINEIDYDQPGTDNAEFIELYNNGTSAISLDGFSLELINGNNGSGYRSIDLAGFSISANDYLVVCNDGGLVGNCDYSFTSTNSWFQNGAPDAVGLMQNGDIVDSLSYEGLLAPYTEEDALTISDSNSDIMSIARINNGIDTNNNHADFGSGCITPGSANIAGAGNCTSVGVSPVPVPAAAWLFGTGLIGLIGVARRTK